MLLCATRAVTCYACRGVPCVLRRALRAVACYAHRGVSLHAMSWNVRATIAFMKIMRDVRWYRDAIDVLCRGMSVKSSVM